MSKAIRIKTTPNGGDKYIKIKLEQDFDFLEVLSLNINQEDVYKRFSSDYGVIVGRVIINGGFGVPNAKVSVFIPLDNIDKNDSIKRGLYPYEKVSDKDVDGIRYNLLTQDSASENECFTPIGTFPTKREVLDNDVMLEVYCKYYKFTTTTNYAGDFMIFGVPLGNHVVHLDADISDIGIASQRPYDMISKGVSPSRFDSTTKFSSGTNLDKLIQVKTLDSGVNVQPFWGDTESYEIGITRLDLDLNYDITPSAIFMGSIFGDHQKNSINKNCRPRRRLGELKEQISNEGTIRMIRKTINNKIEEFNIDGSELIDENGAWAYQIPMNLDYMVTDESGDLILSQDPNKGIPTRARVRFNIGMTDNGGAGRIRTRARYLVPHNPKLVDEIDYEFGSKTNDKSFRDLSWNKIYTVSNFISRLQSRQGLTRAATGIKDVDGSDGNKTVFPFNKVNTETSPLFLILCIIINIIISIVSAVNAVIIGGINSIIELLNKARKIRVKRLFSITLWREIKCLKCITIECGDPAEAYQPGCGGCGRVDNANTNTSSLIKCFLIQLARALNIFQFDFYNDWVNGSLYSFLLKYKKKKNKQEKFCDYECGSGSTNRCSDSNVLDTCIPVNDSNAQKESRSVNTSRGLIKKYNNELYYAATNESARIKLFSTELVNLGSVFECDWQGIPKIQQLLIPTSYQLPPDESERLGSSVDGPFITTGMVDIDGCGLFFNIDCGGVHSNARQVLNIRHACEMGVNLDEAIEDANDVIIKGPDCTIGLTDIDDLNGKWFRDVFLGLNNSKTPWKTTNSLSLPYSSGFNINDSQTYNFVNSIDNGIDYSSFRNYSFSQPSYKLNSTTPNPPVFNPLSFGQPDHSYYFYFGLEPGNTGLDKMNKKFFASCIEPIKNDIVIESNTIPDTLKNGNGSIIFSFIGGLGPFNYSVTGLNDLNGNPLNITPIVGSASTNNLDIKIDKLYSGIYSIDAIDSLGAIVNDIITVNGPIPLYCLANVSAMLSKETTSDGAIKIDNVGGGLGILRYELKNSKGTIVSSGLATSNLIINNLAGDSIGYTLLIYDESSPRQECITNNLVIVGRSVLSVTSTIKNIHCFGVNDGEIKLNIVGGVSPYNIKITGPEDYTSESLISTELKMGQYTATVVDSVGSATTLTVNLIEDNPELIIEKASDEDVSRQCDSNNYVIPFDITSGYDGVTSEIEYSLNGGESWVKLEPVPKKAANNRYTITLGRDSISQDDGIAIRFWSDKIARFDDAGVRLPRCYSEEITYERSEIELAPVLSGPFIKDGLGSNYTAALDAVYQNKKQCSPSVAYYTFSINHLDTGFTGRAPYTIDYYTKSGLVISTSKQLIHYGGLVKLSGAKSSSANDVEFNVRITDNKGCVFPTTGFHTVKIGLPTAALTISKLITTGPTRTTVNNVIGDYYKHVVNVTGGVPFTNNTLKLGNGTTITIGVDKTIYTTSLVLVETVTDANGCVLNIIG